MKKTEVKRRSKRLPLLNIPKGHENSEIKWMYRRKKFTIGEESGKLLELCRVGKSSIVGQKEKQHEVVCIYLTEFRAGMPMMATCWVVVAGEILLLESRLLFMIDDEDEAQTLSLFRRVIMEANLDKIPFSKT